MDCIFCKIIQKTIPTTVVFENDDVLAIHDQNPQAPVHILIVPKHHIATINDTHEADSPLLGKLILTAQHVAKMQGLQDDGYRLIFNVNQHGGQTVFHIHLHLLGGRQMTWPPG